MFLPDQPVRLRLRVPNSDTWTLASLVAEACELSPESAAALVGHGSCRVDGSVVTTPATPVRRGQFVDVRYAPDRALRGPRILYQDDAVVVVDKPAGMPVQPTREGAGNALSEQLALPGTCHVVHRLDLPVSGLLVLARSRRAARLLTEAFAAHRVMKCYVAVPESAAQPESWPDDVLPGATIDRPLQWVAHRRLAMVSPQGQDSRTTILARVERVLLLRLQTGRTHQIRAHLASCGLPLVGDSRYGASGAGERIGLHSFVLSFPHPHTGKTLRFVAPPPEDFCTLAGVAWDAGLNARVLAHVP